MRKKASGRKAPRHRATSERTLVWIISVSLAAIVGAGFGQAIHGEFVNYDDGDYVYANPNITNGLTLRGISWAFTHVHSANWHPLTTISHMLDCQVYGLQPWGHHLTNILLHAAAAILLFLALRKLTTSLWPSAFAAALFAIHPLRVESVAWISERKDVLSGVFFMLTLWAYARYARGERRSIGKYLTIIVLFALGLMCKPTLVTLPFVLLLLDYWPLRRWQRDQRIIRGLVVEKIPLFILSAASCVITVLVQGQALETTRHLSLPARAGNALVSYAAYLGNLVYPARLSVLYPYGDLKIGEVVLALLLLLCISATLFFGRKNYPFLSVGWLWYLGMLVPMIGLVQVGSQPRADRYTYLPQIGLALLVTWGAVTLIARWQWKRAVATVAALLVVIGLTLTTRAQVSFWQNSEALWTHAIETTSGNYAAYDNLGTVLLRQQRPDAALGQFQKALEIKPDFKDACVSAGSIFMLMGQPDLAIGYYQRALQIPPNSAEDWSNLATALWKKGEVAAAIEDYQKAVALKPGSAEMQYNLGHAFAGNNNWPEAIRCYEAAIRLQPNEAKFHNNLAVALLQIGKTEEALDELRAALRINPDYPDARYNLGSILGNLGQREEGARHLREALRLKPDYEAARKRLSELETTR